METIDRAKIDEITKKLADAGKLIEAGWQSYLLAVIPPNASEIQKRETRKAFFAGCQHLFASMLGAMEPGAEPTEADERRMELIDAELKQFVGELKEELFT